MIPLTTNLDINMKILNLLSDKDLPNLCLVSNKANHICSCDDFWQRRVFTKFPYLDHKTVQNNKKYKTWVQYYVSDLSKVKYLSISQYVIKRRLDLVMVATNQIQSGFNLTHSLVTACEHGYIEIVIYLIDQGADIYSNNIFMWIIRHGHLDVIKYLIRKGSKINGQDVSLLMVASRHGHIDIVKYLISLGVNGHDECLKI